MNLHHKIEYSVDMLRRTESLALKMHPDGFYLAFSGGKDSQVLYHLAKMAGVRFKAHMQITTLDPPELMHFVRTRYPEVVLHRPAINFYQLIIKKKMLPLRHARFCCAYLKEQHGAGTVTLIGIRAAESSRRAKRNEVEVNGHKFSGSLDQFNIYNETAHVCVGGKDKVMISPIFSWTDADVWNFIRSQSIEYCSLYDDGYRRIGCIFCPFASFKTKQMDRKRYPGVERAIKRSIQVLIDEYQYGAKYGLDADQVFDWYISNKSLVEYAGMLQQQKLYFGEGY